jgi:hypothetical protein
MLYLFLSSDIGDKRVEIELDRNIQRKERSQSSYESELSEHLERRPWDCMHFDDLQAKRSYSKYE